MKKVIYYLFVLVNLFVSANYGISQSETFNSGAGVYVVPCGVNSITVEIWGGGGAGGGTSGGASAEGGGSGGYSRRVIAVAAGQTFNYSIGAGGAGKSGGNGKNGGNTTFTNGTGPATNMSANGGTGGVADVNNGGGGIGGAAAGGTTNTTGANGANGAGSDGGDGGSAPNGGAGGGGGSKKNGAAGNSPGGGGGGGGKNNKNDRSGGNGGAGQLTISYSNTCSNGIQDCGEAGIDCGGTCPTSCAGTPTCSDAIQNQGETGIDCGGPCPACGNPCTTWVGPTSDPPAGSIVDLSDGSTQTFTNCVSIRYSNKGTNWLHGVFINPASTNMVSTTGTSAPGNNSGYAWQNQTASFTSTNSGNTITADGWFVESNDAGANPGNNLGWPVGANTLIGPFCFSTVVSCGGMTGDIAANISFRTTADSYSGSWTNNSCGQETSFGGAFFAYTLRCSDILGIDLLSFDGFPLDKRNKLVWETENEKNNDYFVIEKSVDGVSYSLLDKIDGKGTFIGHSSYFIYDYSPGEKITYYKLSQYDYDGKKTELKLIAVISSEAFLGLNVVPNPANKVANLVFNSNHNVETRMNIMDYTGKVFESKTLDVVKGFNDFSLDLQNYRDGLYIIELINDYETVSLRFIKKE